MTAQTWEQAPMSPCRRESLSVQEAELEIPADLRNAEVLTIKVGKGEGRVTPHIYEVRLVK